MRLSLVARRLAMLGILVCASCAVVVGLEDKEPFPTPVEDAGTAEAAVDSATPPAADSATDPPQPDGGDAGNAYEGGGEVIVVGQAGPYGIVVDDTYVYWTNEDNGNVMRRAKSLAALPEVLVAGQPQPQHMLIDNSYVYWSNNNSPKKILDGGGTVIPTLSRVGRGGVAPQTPVVLDTVDNTERATRRISLFNGAIPDGGPDTLLFAAHRDQIRRYERGNGNENSITQGTTGPNPELTSVTTDESYAYYFNHTTSLLLRRHKIYNKLIPVPPSETLGAVPAGTLVIDIGVDAQQAYLLSLSGQVYTLPKTANDAGVATALGASLLPVAKTLLVGESALYVTRWSGNRDGQVVMIPKVGMPKVLADGLAEPNEMFIDSSGAKKTLYWTNKGDGTIRRQVLE